jgi:hypothetical protein
LSNLSPAQIASIKNGEGIALTWEIHAPISAGGSLDSQYVYIHSLPTADAGSMHRVVRAGSRKHEVWNPHVNAPVEAKALRYSFEVDNSDGFFHAKAFGCWNLHGAYQADPTECVVVHKTCVYMQATGTYEEIQTMTFTGRIISVEYASSAKHDGSPAPHTAVITCEQDGAWEALRRAFIKDDGDWSRFTRSGLDTYTV